MVDMAAGSAETAEVAVDWVLIVMHLLGGMSLFLFGMSTLSKNLKAAFGDSLRKVLQAACVNRVAAAASGAFATAILSSSTAASVLVVSFVDAGHMTFQEALSVCLGINVGSTLTAHLVAFKITKFALAIVASGFFWNLFAPSQQQKLYGATLFSLGLLFFGLHLMGESMVPLRSYQPFLDLLASMENPVMGILASTVFTVIIQASAATAGIAIVLAQGGFLSLRSGMALILGANIGTCGTAVVTSIGKSADTRRVALVYLLIKVVGVVMWLPFLGPIEAFLTSISGTSVAQAIANTHTVYNLFLGVVFLPFTGQITQLMFKLVPADKSKHPKQ